MSSVSSSDVRCVVERDEMAESLSATVSAGVSVPPHAHELVASDLTAWERGEFHWVKLHASATFRGRSKGRDKVRTIETEGWSMIRSDSPEIERFKREEREKLIALLRAGGVRVV